MIDLFVSIGRKFNNASKKYELTEFSKLERYELTVFMMGQY